MKQTLNAGVGIEIHGTTNTMHISCDYNDIENANQQPTFKQILRDKNIIISSSWYGGWLFSGSPSYGIIAELPFINLSVTLRRKKGL